MRYPKYRGIFGMLSMAIFRLPLWLNKKIGFYKLMGCGKNGTFDIHPDWRQWTMLTVMEEMTNDGDKMIEKKLSPFIAKYLKFFNCETYTIILKPIEGHGTWNGKHCFGDLPKQTAYEGLIGVLTRASIRTKKLKRFWNHVEAVALQMNAAKGFITSVGMGETPWVKGATFSLWESKADMKAFAYGMKAHADVVVKTKQENWYSEDLFVRFIPIAAYGTLHGKNPLKEKW